MNLKSTQESRVNKYFLNISPPSSVGSVEIYPNNAVFQRRPQVMKKVEMLVDMIARRSSS